MYLSVNPHLEVLEGIKVALQVNEGIIKLTGRPGTGKSALCQQLRHQLADEGHRVLYIAGAPQSVSQVQDGILEELGLKSGGNFSKVLTRFLQEQPQGLRQLYVIFDEAERIDAQTFEAIRMLCNLQDGHEALLRPILCGTAELDRKLGEMAFRSIAQYVSQSFTLPAMTVEQLKDFYWTFWKQHGLEVQPPPPAVVTSLFKESQGLPGPVMAKLNAAYARVVDRREGRTTEPSAERPQAKPVRPSLRKAAPMLAAVVAVVAAAGGWYLFHQSQQKPAAAAQSDTIQTTEATESGSANAGLLPPPLDETNTDSDLTQAQPEVAALQATELLAESAAAASPADAVVAAENPVAAEADAGESPVLTDSAATAGTEDAAAITEAAAEVAVTELVPPADATPDILISPEELLQEAGVDDAPVETLMPTEAGLPPGPDSPASLDTVSNFLASWIASWQTQDVDAYLAHYDENFAPADGLSRATWAEQRRTSIGRASNIALRHEQLELLAENDASITVQFSLYYQSSTYADFTLKELVLLRRPQGLRIVSENNLLVERLP